MTGATGEDRAREAASNRCLSGGGETGALMRATDWSRTPLGPVSGWQHGLSVAVSIMLNSRHPMFVWWGSELTYLYNDSHRLLLGDRHPRAVGQPARLVWPEIWDSLEPQARAVLTEGRASWNQELPLVLERKGYREETYFTFSYSPIPDDAGGVGGVYCAVTENTQRVLDGRRLEALGELAARTSENGMSTEQACGTATEVLARHARDVSFALIYLLDDDADVARLASSTGLAAGSPAAPARVDLRSPEADPSGWPLAAVLSSGHAEVVTDFGSRFGALPGGVWPEPTRTVLVLPIVKPGQERLVGFVVAGVSPRRQLDDEYRVFFDLVASHIATAISNARDHDAERRRAEALAEVHRARLLVERDVVAARSQLQFDRMPIACIVFDARACVLEWNAAAEKIFGWRAEEVLGTDGVQLLVPPAIKPPTEEVVSHLIAGEMTVHSVNPNITKDGRIILCEWHNTSLRGPDGQVIGILSMAEDITLRKQAEEALHESQRNLAAELSAMEQLQKVSTRLVQAGDSTSLLEAIVDAAIAITSADMGCIELLDRARGTLDIVESRGLDRPFLEFFAVPNAGNTARGAEAARSERVIVEDVMTSPVFAGTPAVDALLAAGVRAFQSTPLVSRSGALVGVLSTHYRTERRFAQRDLRVVDMLARQAADWIERTQADEALRQSEARFRRTFECNMVPMGVWTRDGGIVGANDALLNMVGYTRAELESGQINWLQITPAEHLHLDVRSLAEIEQDGVGSPFEKEYIHKDGHRIPILIGGAAFTGTADRGVFFAIDLTEQKRAEEDRKALLASERDARSAAESANRLKDDFLATVSHELKTPVNGVLMWLHLLKTTTLDAGTITEALDGMEKGIKTQARLIDDLLELSRIASGKLRIVRAPIELAAVVEAAIDAVMPAADSKGVVIRRKLEYPRVSFRGDATRLEQVFWNLLTNAIKFTPAGGYVDVSVTRIESGMVVSVRDTGKGIDPEFLPHVFERFRQADSSAAREHGGLGLGLSIVKHLVEAHGGTTGVQSDGLGRGTTFTVFLPLSDRADDPADQSWTPTGSRDISLAGVRVLFVDDNPYTRSVLARVIADYGAEIETACSADEALELLTRVRPHILIADIGMPGKDGYELIRDVRRDAEHGQIPGIALTAFAGAEDRVRALQAGFDMHVAKPIDPSELLTAVASLLRVSGLRSN